MCPRMHAPLDAHGVRVQEERDFYLVLHTYLNVQPTMMYIGAHALRGRFSINMDTCSFMALCASNIQPTRIWMGKTIDDGRDWWKWLGNRGGIGMSAKTSWESWWISKSLHLRKTNICALMMEIISLHFLLFQYGIVYNINVIDHRKKIDIYIFSWIILLAILSDLKVLVYNP